MLHFKCLGSTCPSCQSINILRTLKAYDCHLVQSTCSINACYKKISNSSWFSFFLCLLKCLGTTSISFPRAIQPEITVLSPPPSTLWSRTLWIWAPVRPLQTKPFNCHLGSWPYIPYKVVLRSLWHTGYLPLSNIYYFYQFQACFNCQPSESTRIFSLVSLWTVLPVQSSQSSRVLWTCALLKTISYFLASPFTVCFLVSNRL